MFLYEFLSNLLRLSLEKTHFSTDQTRDPTALSSLFSLIGAIMLLFILLILFLKENSQPFCKEHSKTKGGGVSYQAKSNRWLYFSKFQNQTAYGMQISTLVCKLPHINSVIPGSFLPQRAKQWEAGEVIT